ncbi:NACHT domain-containing protein [Mycolicibacterium sp. 120320]|uniref:NACHT domain-containing protein n=1 Tax=Mycolicibacterium sp. 120320 TaxID=3096110 RepID=UPI002ED888D9
MKFKRKDEDENAEWLISALEAEKPKIERLIARGATKYLMATNARGTAQLDVGRVDKVQQWLNANVAVPSFVLWRDEIDRRLDQAPPSLKLKYSEIVSLEDGFDLILNRLWGQTYEVQQRAIRAFVAAQFKDDWTVKFKQVNLSNELLDLFIDVPIGISVQFMETGPRERLRLSRPVAEILRSRNAHFVFNSRGIGELRILSADGLNYDEAIGAAEFILSHEGTGAESKTVLEGAPGQGKSTIAQYVCQVHRAKFLNKLEVLDRVPEKYQQSGLRIPIKVDLRDYASFLDGKSPFVEGAPAQNLPRSLEVFLSQFIIFKSGGMAYTPDDVLALFERTPILLFLDGLDEVADVDLRHQLVASIGDALARLEEFEVDIQVVVTSRPSIFGKAPNFEKLNFNTFTLTDIGLSRVQEYADKWANARALDESDKKSVRKILDEKLQLPHIKSLTTNPMQLTILLSLIHQIGHSLPDQRTDLYRHYIDLFLAREADKSLSVRQHRLILLNFIQYLAWTLQTQAESSRSAGSISSADLQIAAARYLEAAGYAPDLADDLFGGGLERIFVLVERIHGLYEFEVQPLREFFCARHLYSTSPVGTYRDAKPKGDRAQRFEAIAANPFWMNVARFYAGSYENGEIGALVLSLQEMMRSDDLATSIHARRVGLALLQDWVFSAKKFVQDQLIDAIFDDSGLMILIEGEACAVGDLQLDVECGRDHLRRLLFEKMLNPTIFKSGVSYCAPLRINGGEGLTSEFRARLNGLGGVDRTYLLRCMLRSGAAQAIAICALEELIYLDSPARRELVVRAGDVLDSEYDLGLQSANILKVVIEGILDGFIPARQTFWPAPLGRFVEVFSVASGPSFLELDNPVSRASKRDSDLSKIPALVGQFIDDVVDAKLPSDSWGDWPKVVSLAEERFGPRWAVMSMAVNLVGIREQWDVSAIASGLFDKSAGPCERARVARTRRGSDKWWRTQLSLAESTVDEMFWAAMVILWASFTNLNALADEVSRIVDNLSDDEFYALTHTIVVTAAQRTRRADRLKIKSASVVDFSNRAAYLVVLSLNLKSSVVTYTTEQGTEAPFSDFLRIAEAIGGADPLPSWSDESAILPWLRRIAGALDKGVGLPREHYRHLTQPRMRVAVASAILNDAGKYPVESVNDAIFALQRAYRADRVQDVAEQQEWAFQ